MNTTDDSADDTEQDDVSGVTAVKQPKGHGSHRITPPLQIRRAVDMEADESWSWFYDDEAETFHVRRADASLGGLPDSVTNAGVAEARQNGPYLDFAIPVDAVEDAGMEKGQSWRFTVEDDDTMVVTRE